MFLSIIWSKDFDGAIELCFNHFMKCFVSRHKFRPMVKQINSSISRKIIHKYDKIFKSPFSGNRCRNPNLECIRSKGAEEKESLLLKGNFVCLPKWQEVQSDFWNWTEPKWPWEANNWRRDKDGWPRRACHRSGEEVVVVAAVETTCEGIFKSWTLNMRPTLRPVPST